MPLQATIAATAAARRRALVADLARCAGRGAAIGAGAALLGIAAARLLGLSLASGPGWMQWPTLAGSVVALGMLAGVGVAASRRWSIPRAAAELDARLNLDDAFRIAIEVAHREASDPFAGLSVARAESLAANADARVVADPGRALRSPGWAWAGVLLLATAATGLWWPVRIPRPTAPAAAPLTQAAREEAREAIVDAKTVAASLPEVDEKDRSLLREIEQELSTPRQAQPTSRLRAAEAVDRIAESLEAKARSERAADDVLRRTLAETQQRRDAAASELAKSLARADLTSAAETAETLRQTAQSLPPAEREKLAAELENIARSLESKAADNPASEQPFPSDAGKAMPPERPRDAASKEPERTPDPADQTPPPPDSGNIDSGPSQPPAQLPKSDGTKEQLDRLREAAKQAAQEMRSPPKPPPSDSAPQPSDGRKQPLGNPPADQAAPQPPKADSPSATPQNPAPGGKSDEQPKNQNAPKSDAKAPAKDGTKGDPPSAERRPSNQPGQPQEPGKDQSPTNAPKTSQPSDQPRETPKQGQPQSQPGTTKTDSPPDESRKGEPKPSGEEQPAAQSSDQPRRPTPDKPADATPSGPEKSPPHADKQGEPNQQAPSSKPGDQESQPSQLDATKPRSGQQQTGKPAGSEEPQKQGQQPQRVPQGTPQPGSPGAPSPSDQPGQPAGQPTPQTQPSPGEKPQPQAQATPGAKPPAGQPTPAPSAPQASTPSKAPGESPQQEPRADEQSTPDSNPPNTPPDGLGRMADVLKQMAKHADRAKQSEQDSQRLREQARKLMDSMSPQQKRELEQLAHQLGKDGEGRMIDDAGSGLGPMVPPRANTPLRDLDAVTKEPVDFRPKGPVGESPRDRVLAEWEAAPQPGQSLPGAPGMNEGVRRAAEGVERAIEQQQVPPRYSDLVRRVFKKYVDRTQPPTTPPSK